MNNVYYYTFYLIVQFVQRLNPNGVRPYFTGTVILSAVLFFNGVSVLILSKKFSLDYYEVLMMYAGGVGLIILNYFMLVYNGKGETILLFFDKKFMAQKPSRIKFFLITVYIIYPLLLAFG